MQIETQVGIARDEGLRQFMLSVFNNMGLSLAISGLVAYLIGSSPAASALIWGTALKWLVIFAPVAFVFAIPFLFERVSSANARVVLYAFAALMGLSLSAVFVLFKLGSIVQVFFITASTFGATALYGYTTKRDLSSMGSFLMMGVIGLVIAGIVNLFLASSILSFAISCIAVLVFTGLTAYETQNLKELYVETDGDEREKIGVMGALNLYLNFINLFQALMNLLGDRK